MAPEAERAHDDGRAAGRGLALPHRDGAPAHDPVPAPARKCQYLFGT